MKPDIQRKLIPRDGTLRLIGAPNAMKDKLLDAEHNLIDANDEYEFDFTPLPQPTPDPPLHHARLPAGRGGEPRARSLTIKPPGIEPGAGP
ncbi:hypothetical protein [Streptomyces sp. AK02-01A]|uniref:hypothetical protein n=1 Tax=Streptomyces sp. AK02-01A TaxID=3028648 RepID=UPI0029B5522E|nr:hypothetical protein [Streptomyces sp. AK02-01A]MDX3855672.1 hypothetical protein [Streptomyces sp. AK02-01A]